METLNVSVQAEQALLDQASELVRRLMAEKRLSVEELAGRMGLAKEEMTQLLCMGREVRLGQLGKLLCALGERGFIGRQHPGLATELGPSARARTDSSLSPLDSVA